MIAKLKRALAIGGSAGAYEPLYNCIRTLPSSFPLPIFLVMHFGPGSGAHFIYSLNQMGRLRVKECDDKEVIYPGTLYVAPHNYHMLVEDDNTVSLSGDEKVCYARPSIDVLFDSCADVYKQNAYGILLSGSNHDGAAGLARIKRCGGTTIIQNPTTAVFGTMPRAAQERGAVDHIIDAHDLAKSIMNILKLNDSELQHDHK